MNFGKTHARSSIAQVSRMAIGVALVASWSAVAVAQEAPAADEEETIVVTGYQASLNNSARIKRETVSISDSISAEDIGKLPDVSIADSLARLPGVTAQRLEGRDQRLSIRGLGPDFSTTLLNGREQVTVGDNRGVEYDQYPSEFFKNVTVYKGADASLIAAGIAGTVDLRMPRPLEQRDRVLAVQARVQKNGLGKLNPDGKDIGYRASATYMDKFADDTWGIALGLSLNATPSQNERYAAWGYPTVGSNLALGGAKPYVQTNQLNRYGGVLTLQYAPSDNWTSTLDVLYTHFKETQRLRGIEFPLVWGGITPTNTTVTNGFITKATFPGVVGVQRNDINERTADSYSVGWNNKLALSDGIDLTIDASWSRAERTDFLLETYTGTGYNKTGVGDSVTITQQPNGIFRIVPTLNYADTGIFKITDPQGWGYNGTTTVVQAGFLNRPDFSDDLKALRATLNGELESSFLKSWEVGANYSRRRKVSNYTSFFLCPKGGGTNCTVASGTPTAVNVPDAAKIGTVSLDYLGVPQMLALDPMYLYNNTLNAVFDNRPSSLVRNNSVTENVITGYGKLNIDADLGGKRLAGSIGVQVVHTKQSSNGSISNFANGVVTVLPTSGSASYTNVLPSLALSYSVSDSTYLKFGVAQTMVRPRLDQERINQEFNINSTRYAGNTPSTSAFSSSGGNINLRPYQSTNFDIGLEHYFTGGGYFAVAGYYKKLTDFVFSNQGFVFDFSSARSLVPPGTTVGTYLGLVTAPANAGGGHIKGMEATLSLPFKQLTPALEGFGFFGSVSYTDSEIALDTNPNNPITLPGNSDWVGNAELYYEKNGIQAKVSYRYRAPFLAELAGLSANPEFRLASSESILDAQVGYEFQKGSSLAGLSILLQGKNLTDRPFITTEGDPRLVREYQRYGREYYLGISYKF
jgi:iron complex outermembrane recepter protein